MKEGKVPVDMQFINAARVLIPRIDQVRLYCPLEAAQVSDVDVLFFSQAATKLMALANMNRTVHLPTYNKLIGEEAQKLSAEA